MHCGAVCCQKCYMHFFLWILRICANKWAALIQRMFRHGITSIYLCNSVMWTSHYTFMCDRVVGVEVTYHVVRSIIYMHICLSIYVIYLIIPKYKPINNWQIISKNESKVKIKTKKTYAKVRKEKKCLIHSSIDGPWVIYAPSPPLKCSSECSTSGFYYFDSVFTSSGHL